MAARLIIRVATVIPHRTGLRARLSRANRPPAQVKGMRHRRRTRTDQRIKSGERKHKARRKSNVATTPKVNLSRPPKPEGEKSQSRREITKRTKPKRDAREIR